MQADFHELLHDYKREVFQAEHKGKTASQVTAECMEVTEEILEEKFRYHFHTLPDANRVEIINMINNYVREAVLPPVVEKLVHRQIVLEKRFEAQATLIERLLNELSRATQPA